jgi:hypothetical protein
MLRKNKLCCTATDAEISSLIKDWFRYAGDREGEKKERRKKKRKSRSNKEEEKESEENADSS